MDLYPTLCEAADIEISHTIEGVFSTHVIGQGTGSGPNATWYGCAGKETCAIRAATITHCVVVHGN